MMFANEILISIERVCSLLVEEGLKVPKVAAVLGTWANCLEI